MKDIGNYAGSYLKQCRKRAGLTQEELSEKTHFSKSLITKIETGKRAMTPEFIKTVAPILNIPEDAFHYVKELSDHSPANVTNMATLRTPFFHLEILKLIENAVGAKAIGWIGISLPKQGVEKHDHSSSFLHILNKQDYGQLLSKLNEPEWIVGDARSLFRHEAGIMPQYIIFEADEPINSNMITTPSTSEKRSIMSMIDFENFAEELASFINIRTKQLGEKPTVEQGWGINLDSYIIYPQKNKTFQEYILNTFEEAWNSGEIY